MEGIYSEFHVRLSVLGSIQRLTLSYLFVLIVLYKTMYNICITAVFPYLHSRCLNLSIRFVNLFVVSPFE